MQGISLKRLGHNAHILERDPEGHLQGQGAGIRAGDNVGEFLKRHDRVKTPLSVQSPFVRFLDREGKTVRQYDWPMTNTSWSALYYRLRANFDGLRTDFCPEAPDPLARGEGEATYDFGKKVTSVACSTGQRMVVAYEASDGTTGRLTADLVIGADGTGSIVRAALVSYAEREYSGYVAWRGTVPEHDLSAATRSFFGDHVSIFQRPRGHGHILMYAIPGPAGTLEPGTRELNYVWYCNYADRDIGDLLTDTAGRQHRMTLPPGKVRPIIWEAQKTVAAEALPPAYVEVIRATARPFAQNISDIPAGRAVLEGGRALLVGDALALFRPHAAASTNQAALHALLLEEMLRGELTLREWEAKCTRYAEATGRFSAAWGNWNQYGLSWVTVRSALRYLWTLAVQQVTGGSAYQCFE